MGIADHRKQGLLARHAVDHKLRIEDLVATVFGVRLREHHEFHIAWIAPEPDEGVEQVVDLTLAEGQP